MCSLVKGEECSLLDERMAHPIIKHGLSEDNHHGSAAVNCTSKDVSCAVSQRHLVANTAGLKAIPVVSTGQCCMVRSQYCPWEVDLSQPHTGQKSPGRPV